MSRIFSLKIVLVSFLAAAFLHCAEAGVAFFCSNGRVLPHQKFCDGRNDCTDNSDEKFCRISSGSPCPSDWFHCPDRLRCIPKNFLCDGIADCLGSSEELSCKNGIYLPSTGNDVVLVQGALTAERELKSWFLQRRKSGSRTDRWGSEVNRIAVALHLADNSTFGPGNNTGEEIRYELTIQLLSRLKNHKKISSHELALYIHALLVACMDPRDFYGENLVLELRKRVEAAANYTNPFLILVLCNAGDTMTAKDFEKVTAAYDSQHRPFWTDSQALASMALSCISSRSGEERDERILKDMLQELKRHQFRNGTVDNFRTTALVTQALFIHDSYKKDFDLDAAVSIIINGLKEKKSLLNAYYALPVLNQKSLLNVSSSHCRKEPVTEEEALQKSLDVNEEAVAVQYSVWIGDKINLARTWRLRMPANSSIYDAIEVVGKIDKRQKVEYNVVDGKPYVTTLNGMEDDPEMGTFWFVYLKSVKSDEDPKIVEESPVDMKLRPNQEIILWYKPAPWSAQKIEQNSNTSS